jgi:hypothetical protein
MRQGGRVRCVQPKLLESSSSGAVGGGFGALLELGVCGGHLDKGFHHGAKLRNEGLGAGNVFEEGATGSAEELSLELGPARKEVREASTLRRSRCLDPMMLMWLSWASRATGEGRIL